MKKLLVLLLTTAASFSQELLPELKPLSEKHKSDLVSAAAPWEAEYAKILLPYSQALDAAEKDATARGQLKILAAISAEKENLGDGNVNPNFPVGLPRSVEFQRRNFVIEFGRINIDRAKRKEAVDAEFLRALLSLSTKFPTNQVLQKQIASQKASVLKNVFPIPFSTPAGQTIQVNTDSKNLLKFPVAGEGWEKGNVKSEELEENGLKFSRLTGGKMTFDTDLSQGKTLKFTGHLRSITGLPARKYGVLIISYQDAAGKRNTLLATGAPDSIGKSWKSFSLLAPIPGGVAAVTLEFLGFGGDTSVDVRELNLSVR